MAFDSQDSLFSANSADAPLAQRLRPKDFTQIVGQTHFLNDRFKKILSTDKWCGFIFWGPPGTGKTTLASLIAKTTQRPFEALSAVTCGVKEIKEILEKSRLAFRSGRPAHILFIDEVHRLNKAQQDVLLPFLEEGSIRFIGATTENPSFALNNALLSRARVYVLNSLTTEDLLSVLEKALNDQERGLGSFTIEMTDAVKLQFARAADGDARRLLNLLDIAAELAASKHSRSIDEVIALEVLSGGVRRFDNQGEEFYNQISALHKAVRGSSPDGALYWLCRMMDAGCDLSYLARRIVRMASEDIGNADPRALQIAINAWEAQERLGSPEGELTLAQAVVYLACAPKSNAVYMAYNAAMRDAKQSGSLGVPVHLRNAPTKLMKSLDYGKEYRYAHNEPEAYAAGENYFPDELTGTRYYQPVERGLEIKIGEKLRHLQELDKRFQGKG